MSTYFIYVGTDMHRPSKKKIFRISKILAGLCIVPAITYSITQPHTPTKPTLIQKAEKKEKKILKEPFSIVLYNTNYIMPFYYSSPLPFLMFTPPDNQKLSRYEVKYQISFAVPIWQDIFHIKHHTLSLYGAYTQLSFWQLYEKSAFFRETNYEPELFFKLLISKNFLLRTGFSHQSNGQGGVNERSWNRWFASLEYANHQLFLGVKPWVLIFTKDSVDVYNPDISKYLGYEDIYVGYKFPHDIKLFLQIRNVEHFNHYLTEVVSVTVPITHHIQFFTQFFHGYGQSLIEYNQEKTGVGVGFALNQYF